MGWRFCGLAFCRLVFVWIGVFVGWCFLFADFLWVGDFCLLVFLWIGVCVDWCVCGLVCLQSGVCCAGVGVCLSISLLYLHLSMPTYLFDSDCLSI